MFKTVRRFGFKFKIPWDYGETYSDMISLKTCWLGLVSRENFPDDKAQRSELSDKLPSQAQHFWEPLDPVPAPTYNLVPSISKGNGNTLRPMK